MDLTQEQNARVVAQITRWTLVMLQNAEQGLVSVKVLERTVDSSVLAAMGPISPPRPEQVRLKPRVGRVRVHLVTDQLAHVAAVAGRPDGSPAGYVLEFRCGAHKQDWRITELSRVEDRRLVGPDDEHQSPGKREGARRLPADLDAVIRATEHARADAQVAMERATARAEALRDQIAALNGASTWKVRERISLGEQERRIRLDAARWQRSLTGIKRELKELNDVIELREARRLVGENDPLMKVRKPEHLEQLLGPIPKNREDRAAWRQVASTIERYRQTWDIDDPANALGDLPTKATKQQGEQRCIAADAAETYLAPRRREAHHELDDAPALELGR